MKLNSTLLYLSAVYVYSHARSWGEGVQLVNWFGPNLCLRNVCSLVVGLRPFVISEHL